VSVRNREEGSGSGVVVGGLEKGKTDSSNTTWRDEDPSGGKIKTPVPLVIRGVPEEDTECRTGVQLVGRSGSSVGVTRAPEDAKVIVPRRGTEKSVVWRRSGTGSGRKTVEEVGGGVQALSPETSRKRRLKQKGAHGVVGGANHAFSLAIL
jgi:hypothetical protein